MTIGLVLLGIISALLFFGAAEPYFDRLGMTSWLAFLLTLGLIIGAVIPEIRTESLTITVSGFVMPLIVGVIVTALAFKHGDGLRTMLGIILVGMTTVAFRLIIRPDTQATLILAAVITGIVGGSVAYMSTNSKVGVIAASITGCVIGDLAASALNYGVFGAETFVIGGNSIFDAIIIAAVAGTLLGILVDKIRSGMRNRATHNKYLAAETAEELGKIDEESAEVKEKRVETSETEEKNADEWLSNDKSRD